MAQIKSITKQDILEFYDTFVSAKSQHRRKIAAHIISTVEEPETTAVGDHSGAEAELGLARVLVDDVVAFKFSHPLWPLAKPYKKIESLFREKMKSDAA